ncbi:MAG: hypothetical protein P1U81_08530 [Verrucomicrobiales bacterium]|nr:hypothetical protein [Verrucomicrobiales bacterium]
MKVSGSFLITVVLTLSICQARAELRDWTNSAGKTISAELLKVEGGSLTLKLDNGREYTIPANTLSTADQEYATTWAAEQAAIAEAPKPTTEPLMTTPGKVLYQSDLTSIDGEWKQSHGKWEGTPEGLTGLELAENDHAAVMKRASTLKDAIIEFDVMLGDTTSAMFGIDNNDHICRVSLSKNSFQARKDDNDHEGPDVAKPFNAVETNFDPEEWHTVRIELLGEEMLAQTGDLISLGSDPLLAVDKTKWGFVVSGGTVTFRNLTIWEALPNENWEKEGARLKRRLDIEE